MFDLFSLRFHRVYNFPDRGRLALPKRVSIPPLPRSATAVRPLSSGRLLDPVAK